MKSRPIRIWDIFNSTGGWKLKAIKFGDLLLGSCLARAVRGRSHSCPRPMPFQRILVIRPGGIGDAIFLLPFLRRIREEQPDLKIDILCEKRNVQIFSSQNGICDEIFCYDQAGSFRSFLRKSYDVIIDTEQWHFLSALVSYFMPCLYTIGFGSRSLREKLFNLAVVYDNDVYEIENFKKLFLPLFPSVQAVNGISNSFLIEEKTLAWAKQQPTGAALSIFIGASIPLRRLTRTQSLGIIRHGLSRNLSVLILGGKDVSAEGTAEFAGPGVVNFTGTTSLLQTAALIKRSNFFIGPDSGIMHLACAVGTPVIAIFGPGNLKKWGPKGEKDKVFTLNVECSPCTRFGYTVPTCHGSYRCVRDIKLDDIDSLIDIVYSKPQVHE